MIFGRAADKNDGYAMGNLAIMLEAGVGGPRDPARAAQLRAGVSGDSDADFAKRATADPGNFAMTAAWQSGHYADALQNAQALEPPKAMRRPRRCSDALTTKE
jgi:TPR repeat protein